MDTFINWASMNGYASWVWSAYALWALAFTWLVAGTINGRRRVNQQLQAMQRRDALKAAQNETADQVKAAS